MSAPCTTAFPRCSTTRSTNTSPAIARRIEVTIHVDGSISIRDNGRGIPVDIHPQYGIPGVEMVLTTLHSGGKYGQGGYKFSGGTHGVGAKCVNAVSEWFEVEVSRGGQVHHMKFERGKTVKKLEVIGKARGTGTSSPSSPTPRSSATPPSSSRRPHQPAPARTRLPQLRPRNRLHRRAPRRTQARDATSTRTASRSS
jgi:hypothetical protein